MNTVSNKYIRELPALSSLVLYHNLGSTAPDMYNSVVSLSAESVVIVLILYCLCYLLWIGPKSISRKGLPGPLAIPWVGPIWILGAKPLYRQLEDWALRYKSIYQVTFFGQTYVVVSDQKTAKELLEGVKSDRPNIGLIPGTRTNGKYAPLLDRGDVHSRQRKAIVQLLKSCHVAGYYGHLSSTACALVDMLRDTELNIFQAFDMTCAQLAALTIYGDTTEARNISRESRALMGNLSPEGALTNLFTQLQWLPTWIHPGKAHEAIRREREAALWKRLYERSRCGIGMQAHTPCLAYAHVHDISDTEHRHVLGMMSDIIMLTLTAALQRWVIAMARHEEWQREVQQELAAVCGERSPDSKDEAVLPILCATIMEALRWTSPAPIGIPHRLRDDIEYQGYHIPRDTNVVLCDWAIARSPSEYADAGSFKPDRYLDRGRCSQKPLKERPVLKAHHVFGWTDRRCPGAEFASSALLVMCARLAQEFDFEVIDKQNPGQQPDPGKATPHVILVVDDSEGQKIRRTPRSCMAA